MFIVFPLIFTVAYAAFFGFVLGDWQWFEHAMSWPGEAGLFWRLAHATMFTFGLFASFVGGVVAQTDF